MSLATDLAAQLHLLAARIQRGEVRETQQRRIAAVLSLELKMLDAIEPPPGYSCTTCGARFGGLLALAQHGRDVHRCGLAGPRLRLVERIKRMED